MVLPQALAGIQGENPPHEISERFLNLSFSLLDMKIPARLKQDVLTCVRKSISITGYPITGKEHHGTGEKLQSLLADTSENSWVRAEAAGILAETGIQDFKDSLLNIIKTDKDIFLKRRCVETALVEYCGENLLQDNSFTAAVISLAMSDKSPHVRQGVALNLPSLDNNTFRTYIRPLLDDKDLSVRCSAVKGALSMFITCPDRRQQITTELLRVLESGSCQDTKLFILKQLPEFCRHSPERIPEILNSLEQIHCTADSIPVRREAAIARENINILADPEASLIAREIKSRLKSPGRQTTIRNSELCKIDPDALGRVLSCLSIDGFTIQAELRKHRVIRLWKSIRRKFRLWRLFHELMNPSTDKRQTISHLTGRDYQGNIVAHSNVMAELSETGVPGEPVYLNSENGWRPYLPLPDELVSACETSGIMKIFSSEGITEIIPPESFFRKWLSGFRITMNFKKLSDIRNTTPPGSQPSDYIREVRKLGFDIRIRPYAENSLSTPAVDPSIGKLLLSGIIFPPALIAMAEDLKSYFFSLYQNTIWQLGVFISVFTAFFVGRHILTSFLMRHSRDSIPLVIGGWGTRGKSGTERLKAALFSSLGYSVFCKTTGCESFFLYGKSFSRLDEFPLYRPYDKATIWEQYNSVRLASKMGTDVFLWECMGLSPKYVRIMQKQWMKDDYSTITNTYPDHEDIQGPAGFNIAESIAEFVPNGGHLFTAEEQMFPLLELKADDNNTKFDRVTRYDAMLIAPDALKRFPYEEHPINVALVLRLAEELGIDTDYALKEMADNVIPDIGALKRFPETVYKGCNLEFISGMSANEKYACLQNWRRMGLDQYDPDNTGGMMLTTVVNNRADRVPRSKVFAKLLADELSADRHVLIGGNLKGFMGYVKKAWNERLKNLSVASQDEQGGVNMKKIIPLLRFLRIPHKQSHIADILSAMTDKEGLNRTFIEENFNNPEKIRDTLGDDLAQYSDRILKCHSDALCQYREYQEFISQARSGKTSCSEIDLAFRKLITKWFLAKFTVISNYYASGDEIIDVISSFTPPGYKNTIMGLQNIKGTGFGFFCLWKELEKKGRVIGSGEDWKSGSSAGGGTAPCVCPDVISKCRSAKMRKCSDSVLKILKSLIEPRLSIRRRKKADRIYRQLAKGAISPDNARKELCRLNSAQRR